MTILTGIRDARHLVQFLGSRIAIKEGKNRFGIYRLSAIYADNLVLVIDQKGYRHWFSWEVCENPYILMTNSDAEVSMR